MHVPAAAAAHATLPKLRRTRVPERVHGDAVGIEPGPVTYTFKGFGKAAATERLTAAVRPPYQKELRRCCIARTFVHDIGADGRQSFRFIQIDDAFRS